MKYHKNILKKGVTFLKGALLIWASLIVFFPVVAPLVIRPAIAQGFIDAAALDILRSTLLPSGIAGWPQFSADPVTCDSAAEGGYYFNTGSSQFRTCNGSTWADREGAAALNDLSDLNLISVTDGEVLQYDGVTDNAWENVSASANALDDLTDVEAPSPSDGDIMQYDGVTDNRWEILAGASPTTLSGQSDVTITGPANGDHLLYSGSTWENVPENDFPFWAWPSMAGQGGDFIDVDPITSVNQVKVYRVVIPERMTVTRVIFRCGVCTASGEIGIGLWDLDGTTLLFETGGQDPSGSDTVINVDIGDTEIERGEYWLAYTASSTSFTVNGMDGDSDWQDLMNDQQTWVGQAANPSIAGAMPASLGSIAVNLSIDMPQVLFETR